MLDEGRRRFERGQDVVVGAIQPKIPKEVMGAVSSLEVIPLLNVNGSPVMDVDAILRRAPKVCLVDGLAYDNPPGSLHAKRWQDVDALLDAEISVISSVNLQHIEEKRAQVEAVTGKHVTETIPLSFLQTADEILVVDAAPGTCIDAAKNGASSHGKLSQMQLSELREIALLLAADVVDKQLERYLARHGIKQQWGTQERILVLITPRANARRMLETAARNRDRFHGEMIVASANRPEWSPDQKQRINDNMEFAKELGAEIVNLDGENAVDTTLKFARQRGITQIYVGHRGRESWWERCFGSDLEKLISSSEGMDVRVFPHA